MSSTFLTISSIDSMFSYMVYRLYEPRFHPCSDGQTHRNCVEDLFRHPHGGFRAIDGHAIQTLLDDAQNKADRGYCRAPVLFPPLASPCTCRQGARRWPRAHGRRNSSVIREHGFEPDVPGSLRSLIVRHYLRGVSERCGEGQATKR
jgi:hypothetical protein